MKPTYESPLASRYASKTMLHLFSPDMRYETWRRLWVALARAEHTLGLPIPQAQDLRQSDHRLDLFFSKASQNLLRSGRIL